ncbi:hypothetical protein AVEN_89652-1 [Araneus ventricosus]|uniref:Uncharacterized protein n=1 Tax=Araneus ventricosus TaxID=182803 RepID=A0A4Y2EWH7_ARAVE|nr:hypothetical protein AVEN_89652-1 [Araneus ventricosus]
MGGYRRLRSQSVKDSAYGDDEIAQKIDKSKAVVNSFFINPDSYGTKENSETKDNFFKAREADPEARLKVKLSSSQTNRGIFKSS